MGTEGAGSADTAVRDAINRGEIPGPRLRISGNAINILGGHEDAIGYNPEQHVLPNATYANNATELVTVIREQLKEGADFIKIYETGADSIANGKFSTPYQYTEEELTVAVREAARTGNRVAVHATGEPGTLYAARAGVESVDHAYQLSDETMRIMREKQIFAVPTFTISEYFARPRRDSRSRRARTRLDRLSRQRVQKAARRGRPHRNGLRRRPISPRHASPRIYPDGEIRNVAARRDPSRHAERRKIARLAGSNRHAQARLSGRHRRRPRQSARRHHRATKKFPS